MSCQVVVAGALISKSRLLIAQRHYPVELAGLWELPGGKVATDESDRRALARELSEELGIAVTVGEKLGDDVILSEAMILRAYHVTQCGGMLQAHEHQALRWVTAAQLSEVDWVPADRAWLPELAVLLRRS